MLTRDRAPAALTPPAIRPGRVGSCAGFGPLALALALAALGQPTDPPTMAAPHAASRVASLPPYYIEALRARRYPGGRLALGAPLRRGAGFRSTGAGRAPGLSSRDRPTCVDAPL